MSFAILRLSKIKSWGGVAGVAGHHTRDHATPNADPAMANLWLVGSANPSAEDLVGAVRDRIGDRRIRKNAVLVFEVLLTASPEYFRPDAPDCAGVYDPARLDAFGKAALGWLKTTFGAKNVTSAVIHLDEATPHVQALVVPVDPASERLNAAKWTDGREKLSALQDGFAAACWSLGLERGIRGSRAQHTRVKEFYAAANSATAPSVEVEVLPPPSMLRESSRDAWAADESARITADIQVPLQAVADAAASAYLARRKQREAEATAEALAKDLERARRDAALVRDIPLNVVLEKAGYKESQGVWTGLAGRVELVAVQGGRAKFWCPDIGVGGRNGIDLTMCINGFACAEAVAWLAAKVGRSEAIGAAMHQARQEAQDAVRSRPPTPRQPKPHPPIERQPSHLQASDLDPDHGPDLRAR